ncbi:MAG: hypothetical protein IJK72_03025 [Mycoplasma sp.]|nr:hypothetical protein [Mycoplasma sp.]
MSKNSKLLKYEVINTKKDKKLIGEVFDFKKVKTKGGPGDGGKKPGSTNKITLSKLSYKVDNLTDNLNNLAKIVTDGFERQEKFNTRIEKEVLNLGNRLDRVIKVNRLKE